MRVYEVAKELDVSSEALVHLLREMDVPIRSHMSQLGDEHVARLRTVMERERRLGFSSTDRAIEAAIEDATSGPRRRRRRKTEEEAAAAGEVEALSAEEAEAVVAGGVEAPVAEAKEAVAEPVDVRPIEAAAPAVEAPPRIEKTEVHPPRASAPATSQPFTRPPPPRRTSTPSNGTVSPPRREERPAARQESPSGREGHAPRPARPADFTPTPVRRGAPAPFTRPGARGREARRRGRSHWC
jgi:translation initiation factor IF-2